MRGEGRCKIHGRERSERNDIEGDREVEMERGEEEERERGRKRGVPAPLDDVWHSIDQTKEVVRVADHLSDAPGIGHEQQARVGGHLQREEVSMSALASSPLLLTLPLSSLPPSLLTPGTPSTIAHSTNSLEKTCMNVVATFDRTRPTAACTIW